NARIYNQSDITITDCNSYKTDPNLILDGKTSTLWEAAYNSSHVGTTSLPFSITMQLKEAVNVVGIAITRRSGSYVKDLRGGYFELSFDGTTYSKASEFDYGTTNSDMGPLVTACSSTNASYLKLWITMSNRKAIISIAEFNLLTR
ncbi:MAG: discoidin domain-containing protein, partial [Bacteroidales bacterium]